MSAPYRIWGIESEDARESYRSDPAGGRASDLRTAVKVQLPHDPLSVGCHSVRTDVDTLRDLLIGASFR